MSLHYPVCNIEAPITILINYRKSLVFNPDNGAQRGARTQDPEIKSPTGRNVNYDVRNCVSSIKKYK